MKLSKRIAAFCAFFAVVGCEDFAQLAIPEINLSGCLKEVKEDFAECTISANECPIIDRERCKDFCLNEAFEDIVVCTEEAEDRINGDD